MAQNDFKRRVRRCVPPSAKYCVISSKKIIRREERETYFHTKEFKPLLSVENNAEKVEKGQKGHKLKIQN